MRIGFVVALLFGILRLGAGEAVASSCPYDGETELGAICNIHPRECEKQCELIWNPEPVFAFCWGEGCCTCIAG